MEAQDKIKIANILVPILADFAKGAEAPGRSGADKRAEVLELTGALYRGAVRVGVLEGVKELRGIEWEAIEPFADLLLTQVVKLFHALGAFVRKVVARD